MLSSQRAFNLPGLQHEHYRLGLSFLPAAQAESVIASIRAFGFESTVEGYYHHSITGSWQDIFARIRPILAALDPKYQPDVQLLCGPESIEIKKPFTAMCEYADSLWLGEALMESRLVCYMQPVCDASGAVIGYESFARVIDRSGTILAGGIIMKAGKALGIEFAIDKFLHTQAIATFAHPHFSGLLFINFFPGFIQRPAVYLDGLLSAAKTHALDASRLVLDLTEAETRTDVKHLTQVCEFAKAQGLKIALDDVESLSSARKLLPATQADFIKIHRELVHKAHQPGEGEVIASMVELAHQYGARTLGEGVETDAMLAALSTRGVDLFQGYYFSPPLALDDIKQKAG